MNRLSLNEMTADQLNNNIPDMEKYDHFMNTTMTNNENVFTNNNVVPFSRRQLEHPMNTTSQQVTTAEFIRQQYGIWSSGLSASEEYDFQQKQLQNKINDLATQLCANTANNTIMANRIQNIALTNLNYGPSSTSLNNNYKYNANINNTMNMQMNNGMNNFNNTIDMNSPFYLNGNYTQPTNTATFNNFNSASANRQRAAVLRTPKLPAKIPMPLRQLQPDVPTKLCTFCKNNSET